MQGFSRWGWPWCFFLSPSLYVTYRCYCSCYFVSPKVISQTSQDEELANSVVRLLLEAILNAEAAAVVHFEELSANARPKMMRWDSRGEDIGRFTPSRRLMLKALQQGQGLLHIWRDKDDTAPIAREVHRCANLARSVKCLHPDDVRRAQTGDRQTERVHSGRKPSIVRRLADEVALIERWIQADVSPAFTPHGVAKMHLVLCSRQRRHETRVSREDVDVFRQTHAPPAEQRKGDRLTIERDA